MSEAFTDQKWIFYTGQTLIVLALIFFLSIINAG